MAECLKCEAKIEDDATECPECGETVQKAATSGAMNLMGILGQEPKRKVKTNFDKEDLIRGLRTAADGTPMDDFLPSTEWEEYTASLIDVLQKKHLLFPNEITEKLSGGKKEE